jgi:hypothetical protein
MLRQLNDGIQATLKEIQEKLQSLVETSHSDEQMVTLSERLSLFHGLCSESLKFNREFMLLEEWLELNPQHVAHAAVKKIERQLSSCLDLFASYLSGNIEDLNVHFDKVKVVQDAGKLQRMRNHVVDVNAALRHCATSKLADALVALKTTAEMASPLSALGVFSIFRPRHDNAEVEIATLIGELVVKLESLPLRNEKEKVSVPGLAGA